MTITTPVNCSVDDTAVTNKVTILLSTGLLTIPTGQDNDWSTIPTGQDNDWSRYQLVKIPTGQDTKPVKLRRDTLVKTLKVTHIIFSLA